MAAPAAAPAAAAAAAAPAVFSYLPRHANAVLLAVEIVEVSPLDNNQCFYNAIGQALLYPQRPIKIPTKKLTKKEAKKEAKKADIEWVETQEHGVEWVAEQILKGLNSLTVEDDETIQFAGLRDNDLLPTVPGENRGERVAGPRPPETAAGLEQWKAYYKQGEFAERTMGGQTEMVLFALARKQTKGPVTFLIFDEDLQTGQISEARVTADPGSDMILDYSERDDIRDAEEIVLTRGWMDGVEHFDRVVFRVRDGNNEREFHTWPFVGRESKEHREARSDMVIKLLQRGQMKREIKQIITKINTTPRLLDNASRALLMSTREALRLFIPKPPSRPGAAASAASEGESAAAAAAAPRPLRLRPAAASAASGGAAADSGGAAADSGGAAAASGGESSAAAAAPRPLRLRPAAASAASGGAAADSGGAAAAADSGGAAADSGGAAAAAPSRPSRLRPTAAAAAAPSRPLRLTAAAEADEGSPAAEQRPNAYYRAHWEKLKKQRHLLYHFAATRDLCATGEADDIYAAGGGRRPPQTEPSGHTVQLKDYVLAGSLESKVAIRGRGGMLGVFAKEFLDEEIYGIDALRRVTPKQMLQRVLPYRGIVMAYDTQSLLEYEFACPTGISLDPPKKSDISDIISDLTQGEEFTLVGCPTSATAVINSFDGAAADAKKRVNCRYVPMTKAEFKQYGTVQVGRRLHLSDHFLHVCLTRSINKDEELIIDYGRAFWEQQEEMKQRGVAACEECQITMQGSEVEDIGPVGPDMQAWLIADLEKHINDERVKDGWPVFSEFEHWLMAECAFPGCGRAIHKFHWPQLPDGGIDEPDEWFCRLHDNPAAGASAGAASASAAFAASSASSSPGSPARPARASKPKAQKRQTSKKKRRRAYIPSSHADKLAREKRMAAQRERTAQMQVEAYMRAEKPVFGYALSDSSKEDDGDPSNVLQQARPDRDADGNSEGEDELADDGARWGTQYRHASPSVLQAAQAEEEATGFAVLLPEFGDGEADEDEEEVAFATPRSPPYAPPEHEPVEDEEDAAVAAPPPAPAPVPMEIDSRTPPSSMPRGRGEKAVLDLTLSDRDSSQIDLTLSDSDSDTSDEDDGAPGGFLAAQRAQAEEQAMSDAMLRLRLDPKRKNHNS